MGRLSDLCRFFTNESGAAGNSWKESNNRWAISDRITLNGGTDMAVSAKSVIQGIFVEAALSPQMSVVHEEKALDLVLQQAGPLAGSQS